nr:sulfatase-like hydrolase/transferase [Pyxidicoccus fallax]
MIQSSFTGVTAHIANSEAYASLNPGFRVVKLDTKLRDEQVLAQVKEVYGAKNPPVFSRIVLQDANNQGGYPVSIAAPGTPWKNDIYAEGSPFIKEVREADALLGEFVAFLKEKKLWDDTLFILHADGASRVGWHPVMFEDSERIPLIFVGPGVEKGKTIPYAENIDIVPTIAKWMGVRHPNPDGGTGRVLEELAPGVQPPETPRYLKRFNQGVREFLTLSSRMRLESGRHPRYDIALMQVANKHNAKLLFHGIDRIMDWHEAGSLKNLVETNERVLQCLNSLVTQETRPQEKVKTPRELGCW